MIFKNILFTMFWKQQNGRVRYSVLPPGFIESDGVFDAPSGYKPYVNTGLLLSPSAQKKWTVEFSYHGCTNPANIAVMGTSYSKTSGNYALWVDNSDGTNGRKIEFIFGNGNAGRQELAQYKYDKNVLITENRHKYEMNLLTGQGFIDDVCVITARAVASVPNPTPVVFHAVWRGSSVFNTGAGTIHSLKIGDPSDGGLIRDYIPCIRLSDGLPGFYDLCESTDGVDGTPFYKLQLASGSDNPTTVPTYNTSFSVRVKKNTTGTCKVTLSATQMTAGVVSVDWGDDATEELTSASSSSTHSYSTAGDYDLTVSSETARGFTMSQSETISSITRLLSYDCKIVPVGFMYGATSLNFGNNILGNVYWIQASAFRDCTSLTLTELPKPLKRIDEYAFYNSGIGVTRIPKKVNFIGDYAFGNCANLTRITFEGDEVTDISSTAFQGCTNLTDIYVPWHAGEVAGAPWGADNAKIHYKAWLLPPSNEVWYYGSSQATLFSDTNVVAHTFSNGRGIVTFSNPVTSITDVLRNTTVPVVVFPANVTVVRGDAFDNCGDVVEVVPLDSIMRIERYGFYQCQKLELDELPNCLERICQGAFRGCSRISLRALPQSVTYIEREAFWGCSSLRITSLPDGIPRIEADTFSYCRNMRLTTLPSRLTEIGAYAFTGCQSLAITTIPEGVTIIDEEAFRGCIGITSLLFMGTPRSIASNAFYECTNLTDIYVPWAEGDVANAPWGASNATVHYMDGKTLEDVQYTDETMKHHVVKAMYIPSSGGRRLSSDMVINTRHNTTVNDEWIVTCKADHRASGDMCIMGSSNSNTNTNCAIWMNPTTNTVRFLFGDATRSDTVVSTIEYDITKFHTYRIKFSTGQAWIDDNLIGTAGAVSSFANACPLYILTSGQVSDSSGFMKNTQIFNGDVVDVRVLTNDNLTLHYVPWSDLEPYECGFYETVNDTELEMHRWMKPLFEWNLAWTVSLTSNNLIYGLSTKLYDNIAVVYWGDGTFEQLSQTDDSVTIFTHTYAKAGQYNVTFFAYYSGDFVCTTGHNGFINSEPVYKDKVKSVLYVKGTLVPTYFCFKASSITQVPSQLFEGKLAIGSDAFGGCQNLNISSIGNDVQFIGYASFGGCTSLTALAMPSVRHLLPYAFQDCTALESVNLPSIVELSSGSFSNCTGLRSITFGENLCELSYNAFFGCTALETAIFEGSAVEYIPEELFEECTNLTDIYVPWAEGTVNNAPWGATNATVHYNHQV